MQPSKHTLDDLLAGLRQRGTHAAIVQIHDADSDVISFSRLSEDVERYSAALKRHGIGEGQTVALLATGGPVWITACLGLLRARAVPVPLDTQLDPDALRHILEHCDARYVLTDSDSETRLDAIDYSGRRVPIDEPMSSGGGNTDSPAGQRRMPPSPDDMALLFYTSGTTGSPKGVPLTHANLAHQLEAIADARLVSPDDRVLQPLPPHHVYPLVVGTLAPLALGVTIVLPEAMTGPQILAALREGGVTFVIGVPRLYAALVSGIDRRLADEPGVGAAILRVCRRLSYAARRRVGLRLGKLLLRPLHRRLAPRLRVLASGGSALDSELAMRLEGLGWRVAIGYGLTETSPLLTLNPPGNRHLDTVGRAIPGIELRIDRSAVPSEDGEDAPRKAASEGEILARGASVFGGYLRPSEQAANEVLTQDGWFRTGDLGSLDERGYLKITGRKSTLIVTSAGKNIQPDDLEERYTQHPSIDEIGICAYQGGLAAVIVPAAEIQRGADTSTVRHAVRDALAECGRDMASYKRISKFVISDTPLPRTRLGKIRRHRLEPLIEELSGPAAAEQRPRRDTQTRSAETERLLTTDETRAVWELLTRRYADHELTPDTSLQLDLGVDSLGWLELSTDIGRDIGVRLDEERIAAIDTVSDLLELVAEAEPAGADSGAPFENPGAFLSSDQKRWLQPLSPAGRLTASALHGLNRLLARGLFGLQVNGRERLPSDAQLVIAPNHTSFLDPFAIAAALPKPILRRTYWGGWTGYAFRNALFRTVSRVGHVFPIDPDRSTASSLAFPAAILQQRNHLVWFPEGERSATGELVPIKPGLGLLLEHFAGALIVPTRIDGAYEAWPRNRNWPRFRPIVVTFGRPLSRDELAANGNGGDLRAKITTGLEAALQRLLSEKGGLHYS